MTRRERRNYCIKRIDAVYKEQEWTGLGTIKYKNSSVYYGQIKNGKHHGYGRMMYANHNIYHGQWKNGEYHGTGVLWDDQEKSLYDGEWDEGKRDGKGMYIFDRGRKYIGVFSNQRM